MRILFVCSGNAYRSPIAEALLKKANQNLEVDSAGTSPAIPISEAAKAYSTKENAIEYLKDHPEGLDEKDLKSYDLIVAMEQRHKQAIVRKCPQCSDKTVVWNIEDPYFLPHGYAEKIFQQIKVRVEELAKSF